MALPISRNTTYAGGSPLNPIDLNDIQDSIVGMTHATMIQPGMAGVPYAAGGGSGGSTISPSSVLYDVGGASCISSVSSVLIRYHPVILVGRTCVGVAVWMFGNGSSTATIRARRNGPVAPLGIITVTPAAGIPVRYELNGFSLPIASGVPLWVDINIDSAGVFIASLEYLF